MKFTYLLIISLCVVAVKAAPNAGKKVVFSTATSIDYSKIKVNKAAGPTRGSPEYYESNKWVSVSSDGYESTGSLEEVMKYMKEAENSDHPSHPHPHLASIDGGVASGPDISQAETDLSKALDQFRNIDAEKRSIIDVDTRRKVSPPYISRFPYTAMGQLEIGCTGTFIAPKVVLTSAHCVYNTDTNQWYNNLDFFQNKDCDPDDGTQYTWTRAVTYTGYTEDHSVEYDIAVVIFNQASSVQMIFDSASPMPLEIINIAGYPADKTGNCLWRSYCTLREVLVMRLLYPCDTYNGMSGSAVYKYWSPNTHYIYGVHGYGAGSAVPQLNKATRITSYFEASIRSIITQYG